MSIADATEPHEDAPLSPGEDLHIALNMVGSFQGTIQHADTKSGMLFAGQAVLTGTAATTALPAGPQWINWVFTLGFLAGLLGSLWHLAVAIRPRLSGPAGDNRFSLPHVATGPRPAASVSRQRDEAWGLAAELARIAVEKHHRVQRSLPWVGLTVLAFLGRALLSGNL